MAVVRVTVPCQPNQPLASVSQPGFLTTLALAALAGAGAWTTRAARASSGKTRRYADRNKVRGDMAPIPFRSERRSGERVAQLRQPGCRALAGVDPWLCGPAFRRVCPFGCYWHCT